MVTIVRIVSQYLISYMEVLHAVTTNVAVREFSSEPVSTQHLTQILEAGRQCQSAKNIQPWYLILLRKRETLNKLAELMTGDIDEQIMKRSPVAVAIIADPLHELYAFDCGRAAQNMTLTAWELGVGSCMISGPEPPDRESYRVKAGQLLGVPNNLRFLELVVFGYPKVKRLVRTKDRKRFEDIVFEERFRNSITQQNYGHLQLCI